MTPEERIAQMLLLARLSGWDRDRFEAELRARYPLGPTPQGPIWTTEEIDKLYALRPALDD